ncbi:helix-turn-helix transcriptional regulator [Congregibacter variabilis]|uniref:Helix-turn-helix transcriptional regulator n=1 Tax=Congregibacter variabilis TaxID=3081200 RepID=A0ABZ0I591_9GAMM|nr:helix-turn-helix transcriptional regulator [Congregibacter sp. IMCC43200]
MKNDNDSKYARIAERAAAAAGGSRSSLIESLIKGAGKVAGGTLDLAVDVATMSAMFGDSWVRDLLLNGASPERLEAMAEAGHFLRDARETAGLSIAELSDRLDLGDEGVLEGVERGEATLPLELMLRTASLLARHDPVPFFIKFLRSYNPQLEATLEQWGVMALPRNFERERRFVNLYRQHDFLRDLSDDGYQRFIEYMDSSTQLVVDVMQREAAVAPPKRKVSARRKPRAKSSAASSAKKARSASAPTNKAKPKAKTKSTVSAKPVVRKVKPRSNDR